MSFNIMTRKEPGDSDCAVRRGTFGKRILRKELLESHEVSKDTDVSVRSNGYPTSRLPSGSSRPTSRQNSHRLLPNGLRLERGKGYEWAESEEPPWRSMAGRRNGSQQNWRDDTKNKTPLQGHQNSQWSASLTMRKMKQKLGVQTNLSPVDVATVTRGLESGMQGTDFDTEAISGVELYEQDMLTRCGISPRMRNDDHKKKEKSGDAVYTEVTKDLEKGNHEVPEGEAFVVRTSTNEFDTENNDAATVAAFEEDHDDGDQCIAALYLKNEKDLEEDLCHLRDQCPDNIVRTVVRCFDKFVDIFSREDISSKETTLVLSVLSKACQTRRYTENLIKILCEVKDSNFMKSVMPSILGEIHTLKMETDSKAAILDSLILIRCIATHFPNSITLVFGLDAVLQRNISIVKSETGSLDKHFLKEVEIFSEIKGSMMERSEKEKRKAQKPKRKIKPPDDFRSLSAFPCLEDIYTKEVPFLRKNKKIGGYEDVDEYLDTQFRLLREDFIQPLRDGMQEYLDYQRNPRIRKSIRVYDGVSIAKVVWSNEKILHTLCFDVTKFQKVTWEYSKRLVYGTLLCLSNDNFQTFYLATVAQSERAGLYQGIVTVEFQLEYDEIKSIPQYKTFVMLETPAYFEAYKHVLEALQTIEDDMPFAKYIVFCETDCKTPLYLRNNSLNFSAILTAKQNTRTSQRFLKRISDASYSDSDTESDSSEFDKITVAPDSDTESDSSEFDKITVAPEQWPKSDELHLNDAQYMAFKDALSKEFCIIQGPPGTGKTYLGLKIVQTLLANLSLWHDADERGSGNTCPILLVCYTNHALDQFMEGVLKFIEDKDINDVVRIGGRSQNEAILKCSLKNRRTELRSNREVSRLRDNRKDLTRQIETCQIRIRHCEEQVHNLSEGIVHEDLLKPFMGHHFYVLTGRFDMRNSNPAILNWLGFSVLTQSSGKRRNRNIQPGSNDTEQYFSDNSDLIEKRDRFFALTFDEIRREYTDDEPKATGIKAQKLRQLSNKKKNQMLASLKQNLQAHSKMNEAEANNVDYIWNMSQIEKWRLYHYWLGKLQNVLIKKQKDDLRRNLTAFQVKAKEYEACSRDIDRYIVQNAKVIGMTTTGAAKNRELLKIVAPRIVVIEEAAEVLESHTVTSIYPGCEHLILIGDHKQLRPNPNVYLLAKRYNLDISLFERMVNNGYQTNTLKLQHRMRPCISRLMRHIYLKLDDHPSVDKYENIRGVGKNLFFINHSEKERGGEDSLSHANDFEASYIVKLVQYLLLQSYSQSQITVLSTYLAQVSSIRKLLPKKEYRDLVVTAVDNFQGEENDIILLSLVRSNEEEKVGFLKTENRVCVALSRAKMGMYVIGNFDVLAKKSDMWRRIVNDVKETNEFGPGLPLYCQNHVNDEGIVAVKPQDFNRAPDGGCMKKCDFRLECGHVCRFSCHPVGKEHKEYQCQKSCLKKCSRGHDCENLCFEECSDCEVVISKLLPACNHIQDGPCFVEAKDEECKHPCEKKCPKDHPCTKLCHEYCGNCKFIIPKTIPSCGHTQDGYCYIEPDMEKCINPCEKACKEGHICKKKCHEFCGKCLVQVSKIIPKCGHSETVECYIKPEAIRCQNPCERTCPEGHKCENKCSEMCSRCMIEVKKRIPKCGHSETVPCYYDPKYIKCQHQCERKCTDGHPCQKKCYEDCGPCSVDVEKVLPVCGHVQSVKCSDDPSEIQCQIQCEDVLRCGHICGRLCGETCQCKVFLFRTLQCGHEGRIMCEDRHRKDPDCTVRCNATLMCGHLCEGSCKECSGGRLHRKCTQTHSCLLVCGHEGVLQGTYTEPCSQKCPSRCDHGPCNRLCGEPCSKCKVRHCTWRCPHRQCRKACSEYCNRPPCSIACNRTLPCKHKCVGLCGERCPEECKVCDEEEFPETFMGRPVDPSTRYVCLLDCEHILEVSFLDFWMRGYINKHGVKVIGHRKCPFCLTPIRNNPRYGNTIKEIESDLDTIYSQYTTGEDAIQKIKGGIQEKIQTFSYTDVGRYFSLIDRKVPALFSLEIQMLLLTELHECEARLQSVNSDCQCDEQTATVQSDITYLQDWLLELRNYFSEQEQHDVKNELKRLKLLVVLLEAKHGVRQPLKENREDIMKKLKEQRVRKERYDRMFKRYSSRAYLNMSVGILKEIEVLEAKLEHLSEDEDDVDKAHAGRLSDAANTAVGCCIKLLQHHGKPPPRVYVRAEEVVGCLPDRVPSTFTDTMDNVTAVPKSFVFGCWFKCDRGHIFYEGSPYQIPNPDDVTCPDCRQMVNDNHRRHQVRSDTELRRRHIRPRFKRKTHKHQ